MTGRTIVIDQEHAEFLTQLLESELRDKRVEFRHTATHEYKDRVREEEQLVRDLLTQLQQ